MINLCHGIYDVEFNKIHYRSEYQETLPDKFFNLLLFKSEKWNRQYKTPLIPFALAHDTQYDIWAISIIHPLDLHKGTIKIAENIVRGRIKREVGMLNRKTYTAITVDSMFLAESLSNDKLIIPFPDYIISPFFKEE